MQLFGYRVRQIEKVYIYMGINTISTDSRRQYFLDNLKLLLTVLVVFHHAAQAHNEGAYWPYSFEDTSMLIPWIWKFLSTNASFFMGLFFLIAGYFVPISYDRQNAGVFVKKKLLHLGIPCALMSMILSLMVGHFEIGHMWFVENLLVFSLLYVVYRLVFKPKYNPTEPRNMSMVWFLVIAMVMGLAVQIVRGFSPQDRWINVLNILYFEPARYPQYVVMFILGVYMERRRMMENLDCRTGFNCLIIGLLLTLGNYLRSSGPWGSFVDHWFGFYESMMSISISFGLIWVFKELFNGTNSFFKWACKQTYAVYIVHLPLMILIQFLTDGMITRPIPEFLFIGVVSLVASFLISWGINALLELPKIRK